MSRLRPRSLVQLLAFLLLLGACGSEPAAVCEWDGERMQVDATCLPDDEWPLTVPDGILTCDPPDGWFEVGDRSFAINGAAQNRPGVEPLEEIWLENPEVPGARINIGPLHDLVRSHCAL